MALFSKEPVPSKPVVRSDAQPMAAGTTFIGPNVIIDGTLGGSEPIVIEGTVHGKINLSADLVIGKKARVEAVVHAKNVIVEGRLNGDVSADDRVELVTTANVDGNIKAPKIIVAEGAKFRGNVDMGSARPREAAVDGAAKAK
jgi:cytoskeletal protein CcmA (bactofilin family)